MAAVAAAVALAGRGGWGQGEPRVERAPGAGSPAPTETSGGATGYAPASAAPSDAIPGGSLKAHEGVGGSHTLERHVGLSPQDLARRAAEEGKREVSTFPDVATADRSVAEVLYRRRDDVRRWLERRPRQNEDFEARLDATAGLVHRRGSRDAVPGRTVRVVLVPTERFPEGFRVLTAYVTLP